MVVPVDRVLLGVVSADVVGIEHPGTLTGVTKTDSDRCAGHPRQKASPKQALEVHDQIIATPPQTTEKAKELAGHG
jgi:hypothetical protein